MRSGRRTSPWNQRSQLHALIFGFLLAAFSGCDLMSYQEYNPVSSVEIDFFEHANRLSFGTSSGGTSQNWVRMDQSNGTLELYAWNVTNSAGKIAGSEDGISFCFKEVEAKKNFRLSADVEVLHYGGKSDSGETTSNGQEAFGLMARDYVPQYPGKTMAEIDWSDDSDHTDSVDSESYYAGSTGGSGNMILAGAVKRGVRTYYRRGVASGAGVDWRDVVTDPSCISDASRCFFEYFPVELADYSAYPTLEDRPDFPLIGGVYRITLEKNNSGFVVSLTPPAEKGTPREFFIPEPDILTSINPDHYYVGFFAARAAHIRVSNVSYSESNQKDDAPKVEPSPEIFTPEFSILSPDTNSDGRYKLYAMSNVRGYISVVQDGVKVPGADYKPCQWMTEPTSSAVEPFAFFEVPVYDLQPGENVFQITFYPEEGPYVDNIDPIRRTFLVNRKSYFTVSTPIYASPDGSRYNSGTYSDPLDIDTAISYVMPGQTIVMKNGVYELLSFNIPRYNNGRYGSPKRIVAEERDEVFIDFKKNSFATGAVLAGDYWEISGIHIRNTSDKVKGFQIMGNNNLIEWVKTYNHGDTGLQISGRSTLPKRMWPRNNTIRYCESYNNMDAAQTDADGFAAKLTVGEGNRFEWCVSHNNGDDGWDLFTKKETGTIGVVTIENCISYQNGLLMDGTQTKAGRNGFKLGGEGLPVPHVITNCLAFQNGAHGFTSNSNPAIQLTRVTSFDNGGMFNIKSGADSRNFTIYDASNNISGPTITAEISGLLSLYTDPHLDSDGTNRKEDKVRLVYPEDGFAWYGEGTGGSEGTATRDINGNTLSMNDVRSTTLPLWNESFTTAVTEGPGFILRNGDGTLDLGDFLVLNVATAYPVGCSFE